LGPPTPRSRVPRFVETASRGTFWNIQRKHYFNWTLFGGALVLSVLEHLPVQIHKAILIASFGRILRIDKGTPQPILQPEYDWEKIKSNVRDLIYIHSGNDPWTIDEEEGLYMWRKTGGTLIVRSDEGHMGSDSFNQPYKTFPLLEKLLELDYSQEAVRG